MKQIRNGVFETNSSSTHSFTVEFQNTDTHNLVQYGGLRYENLKNLVVNIEDSGWILVCSRYEEKFSLIVHAVLSYLEDSNASEEIKNELINILKSRCEYELIILDKDEDSYFSMYDDNEGSIFDKCNTLDEYKITLNAWIDKAGDDDIIFKEQTIEW